MGLKAVIRKRRYLEQTHFQVVRGIDQATIYQHFTVRRAIIRRRLTMRLKWIR